MDERDKFVLRVKSMEEMERFEVLWELVRSDWRTVCYTLWRVDVDMKHLKALFDMGLVLSDVSSCMFWIELAANKVGLQWTIGWIRRHLESAPLCVHKSFYSLGGLVHYLHDESSWGYRESHGFERLSDEEYECARNAVRDLKACFDARHPKFLTTTSMGSHPDGRKR